MRRMIALFDVGNTHTHIGLAGANGISRHIDIPTAGWKSGASEKSARRLFGRASLEGAAVCSVVPAVTPLISAFVQNSLGAECFILTARSAPVGIDYPRPATIGPDRLANAVAVTRLFRPPAVVVDFGTAVTFDVVDKRGAYVGGVIAPGLNVMTDYLHEKPPCSRASPSAKPAPQWGKAPSRPCSLARCTGIAALCAKLLRN